MKDDNPFQPHLSEKGCEQAQALIDDFKKEMEKVANNVLSDLYCDVAWDLEGDSWTNYRNELLSGFTSYNKDEGSRYDFKRIRAQLLVEHREEIIKDLNQDLVVEVDELKARIKHMEEYRW